MLEKLRATVDLLVFCLSFLSQDVDVMLCDSRGSYHITVVVISVPTCY